MILVALAMLFAVIYLPTIQSRRKAICESTLRGSTSMRRRCRGCCRG